MYSRVIPRVRDVTSPLILEHVHMFRVEENQRCTGNKYCRIVASFINLRLIESQEFYSLG